MAHLPIIVIALWVMVGCGIAVGWVAGAAIGAISGIVAFLGTLMVFPTGRRAVAVLLKAAWAALEPF